MGGSSIVFVGRGGGGLCYLISTSNFATLVPPAWRPGATFLTVVRTGATRFWGTEMLLVPPERFKDETLRLPLSLSFAPFGCVFVFFDALRLDEALLLVPSDAEVV